MLQKERSTIQWILHNPVYARPWLDPNIEFDTSDLNDLAEGISMKVGYFVYKLKLKSHTL